MNILFFGTYYHPYISGITTYPRGLLGHLRQNHHVTVLTFAYKKGLPAEDPSADTLVRMPYFFRVSKGFISPQCIAQFFRSARSAHLVILNIPNFEGLPLAIIARTCGIPVISIYHCQVFMGNSVLEKIANAFLNFSVRIQLRLSQDIVIYTDDYFDSIENLGPLKPKTVPVLPPIPNLIVDKNYIEELRRIKAQNYWVGFSGRVAREKGIENILSALEILKPTIPNIALVMAGPTGKEVPGESGYTNTIVQQARCKNIPVSMLGTLNQGRLGAFYSAIDILLLPSTNQTEAFGMVQVEAMQAGTPVIASNLPGVRFPIQHTGMGVLVEPNDIEALAAAIARVLLHPQQFVTVPNRDEADNIFNIKKTFAAYDRLIGRFQ